MTKVKSDKSEKSLKDADLGRHLQHSNCSLFWVQQGWTKVTHVTSFIVKCHQTSSIATSVVKMTINLVPTLIQGLTSWVFWIFIKPIIENHTMTIYNEKWWEETIYYDYQPSQRGSNQHRKWESIVNQTKSKCVLQCDNPVLSSILANRVSDMIGVWVNHLTTSYAYDCNVITRYRLSSRLKKSIEEFPRQERKDVVSVVSLSRSVWS